MLLSGAQRKGARVGRRAGAQQRVVGWLDAGWQHQWIVVDVGAAPTVLTRCVIDCQRPGVDLPAVGGPGQRGVVRRVIGLADRYHQPPLPWMLRDLADQLIEKVILVACRWWLCAVSRNGLRRHR